MLQAWRQLDDMVAEPGGWWQSAVVNEEGDKDDGDHGEDGMAPRI